MDGGWKVAGDYNRSAPCEGIHSAAGARDGLLVACSRPGSGRAWVLRRRRAEVSDVASRMRGRSAKPVKAGAILFIRWTERRRPSGRGDQGGSCIPCSEDVPLGVMKVSISVPEVVGTKKIYDTRTARRCRSRRRAPGAANNEQSELPARGESPGETQRTGT